MARWESETAGLYEVVAMVRASQGAWVVVRGRRVLVAPGGPAFVHVHVGMVRQIV